MRAARLYARLSPLRAGRSYRRPSGRVMAYVSAVSQAGSAVSWPSPGLSMCTPASPPCLAYHNIVCCIVTQTKKFWVIAHSMFPAFFFSHHFFFSFFPPTGRPKKKKKKNIYIYIYIYIFIYLFIHFPVEPKIFILNILFYFFSLFYTL